MKIENDSILRNANKRQDLKKIPLSEIELISTDEYWDGPLSGECIWQQEKYYYQCFDQIDPLTDGDVWPRKYLLLSLTSEQRKVVRDLERFYSKSADNESAREHYLKLFKDSPRQKITREQIIAWFEMK